MKNSAANFPKNAAKALKDDNLQYALQRLEGGFRVSRRASVAEVDDFEGWRTRAKEIKTNAMQNIASLLEEYEKNVIASGGKVHWARDSYEANRLVGDICRAADAKSVTKGKSMTTEETGLNAYLADEGFEVVETDLGEYIIQLRGETPSHIVGPAFHVRKEQIAEDFKRVHTNRPADRNLEEAKDLVLEARQELRAKFLNADVGITGANLLIAETGSSVIVTNEGNGDLTQTMAKVHIVVASIEKIIPSLEDSATFLRILSRSATGQAATSYVTFSNGARRDDGQDGPEEYHVVLLDNGRSNILGTENEEVLHCIRCGACMNHCPVYAAVGGHAYGWVYPGPIGAALSPALEGSKVMRHLPNASTFCGRCDSVCPVKIPLSKILRNWRNKEFQEKLNPPRQRLYLSLWQWLVRHPKFYYWVMGKAVSVLGIMGGKKGRMRWMPFAGAWTKHRDFPAPEGRTFQSMWKEQQQEKSND